ncbi:DinB family protein [Belliella marina]|uniref:DinB family protein n=1 Tax=Belliella marina TaxID=1644146 RepID=A0ABW4VKN2_9BACT
MDRKIVENIRGQLKDVQNGITWYDDNIEKKIKPITEKQAFIRPIPEIHSIAELISHIWVWRMHTLKKLKGLDSNLTIESPENWKGNEELKTIGWTQLKEDLKQSQHELVQFLADKDDAYLESHALGEKYTPKQMAEGIIHHDLYHLGQIGITIKLLNDRL